MADKVSINLLDCMEKTKKDGSKYYIIKDIDGVDYISKLPQKEGTGEYFVSIVNGEFNGKPTVTRWLSTEEYKPKGKDGKTFFPKTPDKVAILKEAGAIVDAMIAMGIEVKCKTREELWARIDRELVEVNRRVK